MPMAEDYRHAEFDGRLIAELRADCRANGGSGRIGSIIERALMSGGFQLMLMYRLERRVWHVPGIGKALGRVLRQLSTMLTSCHVSPAAFLSPGISFPHATGIVIGFGVRVESGVQIYQGVTLGMDGRDRDAYPSIGAGATLFANSCVFGPIRVGADALVGANSVVLQSVPDSATAVGAPARIIVSKATTTSEPDLGDQTRLAQ